MHRFEDAMKELVTSTEKMGMLVSSMIGDSVVALDEGDAVLAERTIRKYEKVSEYDTSIEDGALKVLLLFQPASTDVRTIATILKTITYLERIGKYSKNISKAAIFLSDKDRVHQMDVLPAMGDVAVKMVNTSVEAFVKRDTSELKNLGTLDSKLDSLRADILRNNIGYMRDDPGTVDVCTFYISVSRYLERVGDHACKIGEKVAYMVTGEHTAIE